MNYEITGTTRLTCLLGSPVAHSISPQMHNEAFRLLGLDYVYTAFDVSPEYLKEAVYALKLLNARGFNLTMPHKTAILEMLDSLTPAATLAQAVNTVIFENGKLIGHTTDGIGYMRSVEDAGFSIIGKNMTLLGAGGAATAICTQAALDGVKKIYVFKRKNASWNSTQQFIDSVNRSTSCEVFLFDIRDKNQLKHALADSAILTNATSVGMAPDYSSPISSSCLDPHLFVSDIIYHPWETQLLKDAKKIGCPTMNGLYMLLYQGAASFECWTNQKMPTDIIKEKYFNHKGD
ncbi:MAG: shikimate dehydrogenase [Lachnospiraceae bacterium]|jgi:quinate/shikimate dehydrogenase|nr:shikimate dehydrogenase [Lachnospiraceae bacterium]